MKARCPISEKCNLQNSFALSEAEDALSRRPIGQAIIIAAVTKATLCYLPADFRRLRGVIALARRCRCGRTDS